MLYLIQKTKNDLKHEKLSALFTFSVKPWLGARCEGLDKYLRKKHEKAFNNFHNSFRHIWNIKESIKACLSF